MGRGKAFSTVKAWDVFRMLEQFKKDFVFKLGIVRPWMKSRAFDKFEKMDLQITQKNEGNYLPPYLYPIHSHFPEVRDELLTQSSLIVAGSFPAKIHFS